MKCPACNAHLNTRQQLQKGLNAIACTECKGHWIPNKTYYVDHCSTCGGVWLDKNEWNALEAKHLHDEIHRIFSTAWQKEVRREHVADRLDQVYRNRFGAETYTRVNEIRDWLEGQPQREAPQAFLQDPDPYKV